MIVTCPECGARYRLADDAIPPEGRAMRCAACAHRWFAAGPEVPIVQPATADTPPPLARPVEASPLPPAEPAAPPPEPAWTPAPDAADEPDDPPAPRHTVLKTLFALLLSAVFTAGAVLLWVPDLPPFDPGRVPGLGPLLAPPPVPRSPLTIAFTVTPQPLGDGRTLFVAAATLTNPTAAPQAVPALEGRLIDGTNIAYRWPVPAPVAVLPAGHRIAFEASAIGAGGEQLVLRFAR